MIGIGADFDIKPQLRITGNISKLNFANTSSLEVLRNQASISTDIGIDISAGLQYRPFMTQNLILNASFAALLPGKGYKQLFNAEGDGTQYSVLVNLLMSF
ncbi:MAG: hypothetical protein ACRERV_12580 [Methylococcales bacterium]